MVIGPLYFPVQYQKYYFVTITYLAIRSIMTFLWTIIGCYKANQILNRFEKDKNIQANTELTTNKSSNKIQLLNK